MKCIYCGSESEMGDIVFVPCRKYIGKVGYRVENGRKCYCHGSTTTKRLKSDSSFTVGKVWVYIAHDGSRSVPELQAHFKYGKVRNCGFIMRLEFDDFASNPVKANRFEADGFEIKSVRLPDRKLKMSYNEFAEYYMASKKDQRYKEVTGQ